MEKKPSGKGPRWYMVYNIITGEDAGKGFYESDSSQGAIAQAVWDTGCNGENLEAIPV